MATTKTTEPVDMKLEVVVVGVSDVDRAKTFYEKLGVDSRRAISALFSSHHTIPNARSSSVRE